MKYIFATHTQTGFFLQTKMVKIGLQLKALLENVTGIEVEGEDFRCEIIFFSDGIRDRL
jgi:hypothetical protein